MSKNRYINTKFWDDAYIMNLDPIEKLLFLYFLTNPLTNIIGVYEIQLKRVAFDTGIDKEMVLKIIERFSADSKIFYEENHIILPNMIRHQNQGSDKVKIGMKNQIQQLPENIKKCFYKHVKGIDTLSYLNYNYNSNINLNSNSNIKAETQGKHLSEEFENFWNLYDKKRGDKNKIAKKFNSLTTKEKETIFATLPDYIRSTPDKKFRKDPSTYLNNKSWQDEIIITNQTNYKNGIAPRRNTIQDFS